MPKKFILCRSWASRAITTAIPDDAGAGGYWHLHCIAKFKGAKVTPSFRQVDEPDVLLENYVDDTHGFMRVEIEDDSMTALYFAVPRPHEPPETPPRVADLFQLQFKSNKLVR